MILYVPNMFKKLMKRDATKSMKLYWTWDVFAKAILRTNMVLVSQDQKLSLTKACKISSMGQQLSQIWKNNVKLTLTL